MFYPDGNNESTIPYQDRAVPEPEQQQPTSYQPDFRQDPESEPPYQSNPQGDAQQLASYPSAYQQYQGPVPPPQNGKLLSNPSGKGLRTGAIIALTVLLAIVFGTGLFAGWEFGRGGSAVVDRSSNVGALQPSTNPQATIPPLSDNNIQSVREQVVAKVKPAVVQINVATARGGGLGSGVIIDKRGYIVTNNHVVDGAQSIEVVLANGTRLPGQLAGTDPADDLAVVKIAAPANIAVANIGDSTKLMVGQEVLAIGNPLGITQTVTHGIVSAVGRGVSEGRGGALIPDAIQTDAPINPGNSGGALVDLQGNLVGIPTLTAIDPEFGTPANGVGFAIPSKRVQFIVPQIIQDGKVTHTGRAALGVGSLDVTPQVADQEGLAIDHGVLVARLVNRGPAAQAGLRVGDVIVQVGNEQVTDGASLSAALITKNPGDTVSVKVYRGTQQMTFNVTLTELQAG